MEVPKVIAQIKAETDKEKTSEKSQSLEADFPKGVRNKREKDIEMLFYTERPRNSKDREVAKVLNKEKVF